MTHLHEYIQSTSGAFDSTYSKTLKQAYASLPLPSKKLEDWKFFVADHWFTEQWNFDVQPLLTEQFVTTALKNISYTDLLVFANGTLQQSLCHVASATVSCNEYNSQNPYPALPTEATALGFPRTALEAFHLASSSTLYDIQVRPSQKVPHIVLLSIVCGDRSFARQTHVITLNAHAHAHITEFVVSADMYSQVMQSMSYIVCKEHATATFTAMQNTHAHADVLQTIEVIQLQDSTFTAHSYPLAGKYVRANIRVHKQQVQATTNLYGIFFPAKNEQFEIYTHVNHNSGDCQTTENYKGLASHNGQGVFSGMVYVAHNAQKTLAAQSNKNILLSDSAKIHSKPQLEIYADDVSCNHGSTTGQINKEALWYMQSRGISPHDAKILLLEGFVNEVLETLWSNDLQEYIKQWLEAKLDT